MKKGKGNKKARKLYDNERSLGEVEQDFYKFIENDKELKSVFKIAGDAI